MKLKLIIIFLFIQVCNAQISDFDSVNFTRANNLAQLHKGKSLDNLPLLCYNLTNGLSTDVEKFRAIFLWITSNIKSSKILSKKVTKYRIRYTKDSIKLKQWNNEFQKRIFKKLLKQKRTMCTGYAYLLKEMANIIGIECEIIGGYGRTYETNVEELELVNHSWNAVKLNGKWYLCDPTWASGYIDENNSFIFDYNNGYFLTEPKRFGLNHLPLYKKWILKEDIDKDNFTQKPLLYNEAFKYNLDPIYPKTMKINLHKNETNILKFKVGKSIKKQKIKLIYFEGIEEKNCETNEFKQQENEVSLKYKLKKKGSYNVHLKINSDIIVTYLVNVK